jgi:hypothetical protein
LPFRWVAAIRVTTQDARWRLFTGVVAAVVVRRGKKLCRTGAMIDMLLPNSVSLERLCGQ